MLAKYTKNLSFLSKLLIAFLGLLLLPAISHGPFVTLGWFFGWTGWLFGPEGVLVWFAFLIIACIFLLIYHALFVGHSHHGP